MERLYNHTYLRTVITSEWKEMKKFSFFIRDAVRILTEQGRLTKRGHKLLWGPHNGVQVKKVFKIAFENLSKIYYITLISCYLKDIGCSLNPKYWKIRAQSSRKFRAGGGRGETSPLFPLSRPLFIKMVLLSLFTKPILLNNKDILWFAFVRYGSRISSSACNEKSHSSSQKAMKKN